MHYMHARMCGRCHHMYACAHVPLSPWLMSCVWCAEGLQECFMRLWLPHVVIVGWRQEVSTMCYCLLLVDPWLAQALLAEQPSNPSADSVWSVVKYDAAVELWGSLHPLLACLAPP